MKLFKEDDAQQLQAEKLKNISDQIKIKQDEIKAKQKEIVDLQQKQHDIQQGKITESVDDGEFKVGDKVKITLEGLKKHSRSIPAYMGYSKETMSWRKKLSDFETNETIGKVERVTDDSIDVDFEGELISIPSYMIAKVIGEDASAAITTSSIGGSATTQSGAPTTPAIAGNAAYVPSYLGMTSRFGDLKKNKKRKKITKEAFDYIDKFLTEAKEEKTEDYPGIPNAAVETKYGKKMVFWKQFNTDSWKEFQKSIKMIWYKGFTDNNGDEISKKEAENRFNKRQIFYVELKEKK